MKFKVGDVLISEDGKLRLVEEIKGTSYWVSDVVYGGSKFDLSNTYVESTYELKRLIESPLYKALR